MGRRSLKENDIRKLQKSGDTIYVTIPKEIVTKLRLKAKQKVVVTERRGKIIVQDWKE